ncbi:MAG: hypothetical protein JRI25_22135 [Deltaproteobacteria bacterium]|nr:hypothetical protein [Deltaproteobacteria bacterium]
MNLPIEHMHLLLSCATLLGVGVLAIAVLPWNDEEVAESWGAWTALATTLRAVLVRIHVADASPPRPIRSAP